MAWREWKSNVLLVTVSICLSVVACELMYRTHLKWLEDAREKAAELPALLHIYWPAPFTFKSYGYDYGPPSGKELIQLELRRDAEQPFGYRVSYITPATYGDFGNFPPVYSDHRQSGTYRDIDYEKADLKILAFGDSFTAGSWPDIFQHKLEQRTGLRVRVINFGRDFFGVNQMMDIAAHFVPRLKPDLFLINIITADLTRPRTWRGTINWNGYQRVVISTTEDLEKSGDSMRVLGDAALVNPAVVDMLQEYVQSRELPSNSDPRIGEIVQQAQVFSAVSVKGRYRIEMLDVTRSFVLNRIWWGNPFVSMAPEYPEAVAYRPLEITDFRDDQRMVQAVRALNDARIRYELIHLPQLNRETRENPVVFGMHARASQERTLIRSLEEMTSSQNFLRRIKTTRT